MKQILLLGGTGAIGTHLVRVLSNKCSLYVTSRNEHVSDNCVTYFHGNARDLMFLKSILLENTWDVVVDFMFYQTLEEFVKAATTLLDSVRKYVFISSARVYADSDVITEESPRLIEKDTDNVFLRSGEYSLVKAEQENWLMNNSNSNWLIIRPYITYSEQRLQLGPLEKEEWLFRALSGRSIVFCEELAQKTTTMTYSEDVSSIIGQLALSDIESEIFNAVSPANNSLPWGEILEIYTSTIKLVKGFEPQVKYVDLKSFSKLRPGKTYYQITKDRIYNRKFDVSKLRKFNIDISFCSPSMGLAKCLYSFIRSDQDAKIQWSSEAYQDKLAQEYASLRDFDRLKSFLVYTYYRLFK